MMDIRSSFEQLLGRSASDDEIARLYRAKDVLGVRENDAIWLMLIVCESYVALYERIPKAIELETTKALDAHRKALVDSTHAEGQRVVASLAERVAATSEALARGSVEAWRWQTLGVLLLGATTFGSFCLALGVILGSGRLPWWVDSASLDQPLLLLAQSVGGAPAGWVGLGSVGACLVASGVAARRSGRGRWAGLIGAGALLLLLAAGLVVGAVTP